jgi:large subunit ribosomal protein L10
MKTKQQKFSQIEEGKKILEENKSLVFVNFDGTKVEDMRSLKKNLGEFGAKMKVVKKKLMRIAFEQKGIDFNPEQFETQMGTVFTDKDVSDIAGPVYKSGIAMLGAYDLKENRFFDAEEAKAIGKLPSREILLAQVVGMLSAPIRMFLYVLNEKSKMVEEKQS